MKKASTWAGIIGLILVISFLIGGAYQLGQPTEIKIINIANILSNLAYIGFGIFLITIYLKAKELEKNNIPPVAFDPGSPEDIERLKKKRNKILAFVFLIATLGSINIWVLNDYRAGMTPVNLTVIFDLIMSGILIYFIVALFRNKVNSIYFLSFYVVYALGAVASDIWRKEWFDVVVWLGSASYVLFVMKAPINQKNDRIAHTFLLPIWIVISIAILVFQEGQISSLQKAEYKAEQEFLNANSALSSTYQAFITAETIDENDILDIRYGIKNREIKDEQVLSTLDRLEAVYNKQLPSQEKILALNKIKDIRFFFGLHESQLEAVKKLVDYVEGVNINNLSKKQRADLEQLLFEINSFNAPINDAALKLNS